MGGHVVVVQVLVVQVAAAIAVVVTVVAVLVVCQMVVLTSGHDDEIGVTIKETHVTRDQPHISICCIIRN